MHTTFQGEYDYGEPQDESEAALGLPASSRSIRDNLVDVFSCEGRPYGNINDNLKLSSIEYKLTREYFLNAKYHVLALTMYDMRCAQKYFY